MSRESRKRLIEQIEQKRCSKVITYITSDRPNLGVYIAEDVVPILHEHILQIDPAQRAKLDLFIYSRGGSSDVPWTIVSMFREYCREGSFSVLIPYKAHSAATVVSLGADEIVMTRKGELGPIDITISSGPYNPTEKDTSQRLPISVEDVTGYFTLLEKIGCGRPEEKMRGFEQLTDKVHPLALGAVSRILQQTQLVALRLLGTRANPFSEEKNRDIVKRLSSEIYSHGHTINRTEAIDYLGLEQVVKSEDADIDEDLWFLYKEYQDLFLLQEPFNPAEHLVANDLDEHTWNGLNLACIESAERIDILQQDIRVRRIRQIPPQIAINVANVALPPIHIPDLPPGLDPEQIQAFIQQVLLAVLQPLLDQSVNRTAQEVVTMFLNALPIANFEHAPFNTKWNTEV